MDLQAHKRMMKLERLKLLQLHLHRQEIIKALAQKNQAIKAQEEKLLRLADLPAKYQEFDSGAA